MLKKIIEKRVSERIPLNVPLKMKLANQELDASKAHVKDISSGGLLFSIPIDEFPAKMNDVMEFTFDVPEHGLAVVQGEICYIRLETDEDHKPITDFGVKFIDLSLDTWNTINDYCESFLTIPKKPIPASAKKPSQPLNAASPLPSQTIPDDQIIATIQLANGRIISGTTVYFGFGGVKLMIPEPVNIDEDFTVEIASKHVSLITHGVCIWCSGMHDDIKHFLAGINFKHLNDYQFNKLKDLINEFIKKITK